MIDKLSLTIGAPPDMTYLKNNGEITEDAFRSHIYKFICRLDKATVLYYPHKFSDMTNAKIPFTKIDINPKNFECYDHLLGYMQSIFDTPYIDSGSFHVTRIDIAADIENFPIDALLSMLRISRIRSDSLSFYKGTIYAGSDPKIRIYDKVKEIKGRVKGDKEITEYEKYLLESGKGHTRFEIQIRKVKKTLMAVVDNPVSFASYYDRLEFFEFQDNDGAGVLQVLYKYINRKFRNELEKYRNYKIVADIKGRFTTATLKWINPAEEPF